MIFAFLLVPLTTLLIEILHCKGTVLSELKFQILFIVLLFSTYELRKNAALIAILLFVILIFLFKNQRISIFKIFGSTFILILIFGLLSSYVFHVEPSPEQEMISVPANQIGLVYKTEGKVSDECNDRFESIRPKNQWSENYLPYSADPMKYGIIPDISFWKCYIQTGYQNKSIYLSAYTNLMAPFYSMHEDPQNYVGYDYYFDLETSAANSFTNSYCNSNCKTEYIDQIKPEFSSQQKLIASIPKFVMSKKIPLISDVFSLIFFSKSLSFYVLFLVVFIAILKRKWYLIIISIPFVAVLISFLVFAPVALFRYSMEMYYVLPIIIYACIRSLGQRDVLY